MCQLITSKINNAGISVGHRVAFQYSSVLRTGRQKDQLFKAILSLANRRHGLKKKREKCLFCRQNERWGGMISVAY